MNVNKLLVSALIVGTAGLASAQSAPNWTGFYLGANAGYGFGKSDVTTTTVFSPTGYFANASIPQIQAAGAGSVSPKGFTGGVTFGYNAQSGTTVYGFEMDANTFNLKGDRSAGAAYVVAPSTSFIVSETTKTDYLVTLRGRVGYATGPNLWFATAGLAMTSIKIEDSLTDTFASAHESVSKSTSKTGWTLGGGYEYAMPNNWSFKAEVLYMDFGKATTDSTNLTAVFSGSTFTFPTNKFSHSATLKGEAVRFGFNYKF